MELCQSDGRSHGSVRHQRTSTEALRALGAWSFSLLAFGPLLWTSQRNGPESTSRRTRPGALFRSDGRHHLGTVGEIISEWWAQSSRNRGRVRLGIRSLSDESRLSEVNECGDR